MTLRPLSRLSRLGSSALALLCCLFLALATCPSVRAEPTSSEQSNTIAAISLSPAPYTSHLVLRNLIASPCFDFSSADLHTELDTIFSVASLDSPEATLAELRRLAGDALGEESEIKAAVAAVPVSWTDEQRQKLTLAAERSGLDLLRILNRPTAASLAYGIDREPFSLPESAGEQSGGPWGGAVVVVDVWGGAEGTAAAEVTLLDVDDGVFEILDATTARGGSAEIGQAVERTLQTAGTAAARIDNYLLVGQLSLNPSLDDTLSALLPNAKPWTTTSIPPHLAAAYGAAIQASYFGEDGCGSGDWVGAFEVTPLSLGVETSNGLLQRLIPRNSILPRRAVFNLTTNEDDQTSVSLQLFAGEHPSAEGNQLLTSLDLDGIEPAPAGEAVLEVVLDVSPDYDTASLSIEDVGSGERSAITIAVTRPQDTEWLEIEESLVSLEKLDRERQQRGEEKPQPSRGLPPISLSITERLKDEL